MKLHALVSLSLIALATCLPPSAQAQTFGVIHNFAGPEGSTPQAGVTIRGDALFGTTSAGGKGSGTVYELVPSGSTWTTVPIYLFSGTDGSTPTARVVFGPDGHLYGTTSQGGSHNFGTVFELIPPLSTCKTANCFWKQVKVYDFQGVPDGSIPSNGDLAFDSQGNIYGTTLAGGDGNSGTIYKLTKSGNSWTESILFNVGFDSTLDPYGGVILDSQGRLFGPAFNIDGGVVYDLFTSNNSWVAGVLRQLVPASDGSFPIGGLVFDQSGNLYGTTSSQGTAGGGTVFQLTPSGNNWIFHVLYSFPGNPQKTCGPQAALTFDAAGNLYGTTTCDGQSQNGNVFKLTNTQNGWSYSSLYDFTGDATQPKSNVSIGTDGTLYGTTQAGGCCGTVWAIKP